MKDCGNKLVGDCYDEDTVTDMKDDQLRSVLEVLEKSVEEWDSDKCPAIKYE